MTLKERPILFSAPMVRAILEGRKTQTRRVVKPQPVMLEPSMYLGNYCRHGQPGDLLWVRESWQAWTEFNNVPPSEVPPTSRVNYLADGNVWDAKKRPSMFMPRWASRITLEVTRVRVERLQDITEADAKAEGVEPCSTHRVSYIALWNTINGAGAWEANPWVWAINFRPQAETPNARPLSARSTVE